MSHLMQTTAKQTKGALQLKEISIIPIATAAVTQSQVEKPSSSNQLMADDDSADSLRKKRCTDRYDSSESSDSGVVTMSADSTATSDASDPGSPFSHTSTCTDDASAAGKPMTPTVSPPNGKTLKRQAQVTEKCDKKRVRKELCSKNNNVEIKIIPITSPSVASQTVSQMKKPNLIKSTLSAITSLNVFKSQANGKSSIALQPPQIAIPTVTSSQQPPNLAQLSTSTPIAATISKLTDYYKLKKEVTNTLSMEKYCNMLLNLQSGGKPTIKGKESGMNVTKHAATTITPILQQQPKTPTKPVNVPKKPANEKKTAKIAPVIPVARKTPTNQMSMQQSAQQPLKISPKKPVSIAPRLEPKPTHNKNSVLQPKPVAMTVNNMKPGTNGKLVATSSPSQVQQNQQPTMLLAAIRIPSQQMQAPTQPPPLKMQNGLLQKTTTTTTTTTKLAPLLQFQQMIPNLIQLPNLIATTNKTPMNKQSSVPVTQSQPNLYVNSSSLTQQQQQQLFMNGAVIKLQPMPSQSHAQAITSSTMSNVNALNNAAQKYAMHQQQQAFAAQLAAQQMQQLFMTTPVLFNTSPISTVLTSQLAGLQHAYNQQQIAASIAPPCTMPALQPIQSSLLSYSTSSMTSTTNSMQLPSISTILHNHPGMAATAQQFQNVQLHQQQHHHHHQNIPTLMKTSMAPTFASLPPSLTITSGYMHNQQKMNISAPPQATVNPSPKAIPPLAPASNLPINISKNLPKLISVTSSSSQTSPKSPPPLVINQKVSLPQGSPIVTLAPALKQDMLEMKPNTICVVPPLPSPAKTLKIEIETEEKISICESSKDTKSAISIIIEEKSTIECAKSPILSIPKTIRFPAVSGKVTVWKKCVKISMTGVCNWEKCSNCFDSNSDLLDHLHQHHINAQQGPFMCSWRDCKVNGREGSKGWLERHVMSHVGSKPFKCIVERCGVRFSSQVQLEKHVNGHFNSSDQQNSNKRSSDPPALKKVKKDQKKTKVRRQPWSARRFDFFDVGMMDILQYRLEKAESVMKGRDVEVTFKGRVIGKRRSNGGDDEYQVTWSPSKIIDDEWIKRPQDSYKPSFQLSKNVSVKQMTPSQRNALQDHVTSITKTMPRSNPVRKSRKFSSTCSSRTSMASTST